MYLDRARLIGKEDFHLEMVQLPQVMRNTWAGHLQVGFKFRPISKGSLFEPDEYLYSFSSETISAKHTSLHFFFYYEFKILKAIDFISPDDEAAALIKTSWIIFIIAC